MRRQPFFLKACIIALIAIALSFAWHIHYLNLLFPFWVDILVVWITVVIFFKSFYDKTEIVLLILWIITTILLLIHQQELGEQLSFSIYFLLAVVGVKIFIHERL